MADEKGKLVLSPWALALAVPPLAILFLGDWAYDLVAPKARFAPPAPGDIEVARHLIPTGQLFTVAALFVAAGATVAVLALFAQDVWRRFAFRSQLYLGVTAAALLAVGLFTSLTQGSLDRVPNYLGTDFMASVGCQFSQIEKIDVPRYAPKSGERPKKVEKPKPPLVLTTCNRAKSLRPLLGLVTISLVLLSIGAAAAVFGAISCLGEDPADRRAALLLQRRRLQAYVNLSAALMVATLIFLISWTYWPRFLFATPRLATYDAHINAVAIYFGVIYSLVILSFAAPITLILRERWSDLPPSGDKADDIGAFDGSTLVSVGKLLAVFAPAIAAAIPALTDLAGKSL